MVEMPEVIWHSIEEGVRKLRKTAVLEWTRCLKLEKLLRDCFLWEGSDDACN